MADENTTIAHLRYDPSPLPAASFVVRVVRGPDTGRELRVSGSEPQRLLVGHGASCELALTDGAVSRRHLALEVQGSHLHVIDLGTTNGTHIGSIGVRDVLLDGNETVTIGATELRVEREVVNAASVPPAERFGRLLGWSREMRRLYPLLERFAKATVPVVIEGETGTGKEAVAEAIHEASDRASGPFLVFDCTAVAPTLVESELFGHEKGAFTGATTSRRGIFEEAHGGTLLIDEIGDLEVSLQSKLLRLVERGEFRRVGGTERHTADVRILAATRRDLDRAISEGKFRDDLFHRLAVGRVDLPPLRARRGDVSFLALHFAEQLGAPGGLPRELLDRWETYGWPGNVRELRNAVARYVALGEDLPPPRARNQAGDLVDGVLAEGLPFARARDRVMADFERRYVESALAKHGGNVPVAASASGIGRRYFDMLRTRSK